MPNPTQQRSQRPQPSRNTGQAKTIDYIAELKDSQRIGARAFDAILKPLNDKGNYNEYIECVKRYVEKDSRKISSSQLRNIFSRIKKIKEFKELYLIRPKLAYLSGRASEMEMKRLLSLLDYLIKEVDNNKKLEEFKNFFEAIIAYHKYYGGKD